MRARKKESFRGPFEMDSNSSRYETQNMSDSLLQCCRVGSRNFVRNLVNIALMAALVPVFFPGTVIDKLRHTSPTTTPIHWARPGWMDRTKQNKSTCQSTLFHPFRVGCPATCQRSADPNETMYRMNMAWYFGSTNNGTVIPSKDLPTAYDMGINYQAPTSFVENFLRASETLQRQSQVALPPSIKFSPQARIHMSLAYFCCLRANETNWVREIMYEWVNKRRPFDFTVKFDRLECWHERFNSVSNIIVADETTQQTVMSLVHDLYDTIQNHPIAKGIVLEVPREDQMPIHVTLGGLHYGEKEGSMEPHEDIRAELSVIRKIVDGIDATYKDTWIGQTETDQQGLSMRITHDPRYSLKGKHHAGNPPP